MTLRKKPIENWGGKEKMLLTSFETDKFLKTLLEKEKVLVDFIFRVKLNLVSGNTFRIGQG